MTRPKLIALFVILLMGFILHKNYITEFPMYTHAWTQSDRLALAHGFVNNDLNFFKPETFSLLKNKPNIDDWKFPTDQSITAVDFPIHDFIPAVLMKLSGSKAPWIFRLYILLYSFIGLFALFKTSLLWTKSTYRSIFITVFAATSPVYVFYQGGFLPTIPSLANAFIGLYFYSKYLHQNRNTHFNLSVLFLTLSGLSRTPFVIPLIAILCVEFLRFVRNDISIKPKLLPVLSAILFVGGYFLYNRFLTINYGSIFLNSVLLPTGIDDVIEIFKQSISEWGMQYFSALHYIILYSIIVIASTTLLLRVSSNKKEKWIFLLFVIINLIGSALFSLLIFQQFIHHDYYFLDTFYLPLILLLVVGTSFIQREKKSFTKGISILFTILFGLAFMSNAVRSQKARRGTGEWDKTTITIENFKNSGAFIDSLQVPKNAKILVLDASTTNIPFILMNRKGFPVVSTKRENLIKALTWDYDFVVIQNEYFHSEIYAVYPEIINKLKLVGSNGKISLYKRYNLSEKQSFGDFFGLNNTIPFFQETITYDTIYSKFWQNTQPTSKVSFSGKSAGLQSKDITYGLTFKTQEMPELTEGSSIMLFSSQFLSNGKNDWRIVAIIKENGMDTYYKTLDVQDFLTVKNEWQKLDFLFMLPQVSSDQYELGVYLWNFEGDDIYLDDVELRLYQQ